MREDRQSSLDPAIRPGQIWLIEQPSATVLFSFDRDALISADVVIYDRALAPARARFDQLNDAPAFSRKLEGSRRDRRAGSLNIG